MKVQLQRLVFVCLLTLLYTDSVFAQAVKSAKEVHDALEKGAVNAARSAAIKDYLEKQYEGKNLTDGSQKHLSTRIDAGGAYVVWAFRSPSAKTITVVAEKGRSWPMTRLKESDLWVASEKFPNFSSAHYRFEVDGNRLKGSERVGFESYPVLPDSVQKPGVPKGELIDMGTHVAKNHFPGAERQWWVYVPEQYKSAPDTPASLIVFNDGGGFCKGDGNACIVLDNLIHQKKVPVCIAVFVNPGSFPAKMAGAEPRSNRSDEYDTCTPRYATFLDEEILSIVREKYKISPDPWDHVMCGSSSGASCAFTAAWHRNDLFRRVISFVGSYCDFRQVGDYPVYSEQGFKLDANKFGQWKTAHDYPGLIRKVNPKREIKVVLQDGENDLDNILGNWFLANEEMAAALAYSGYDYKFIPGKGIHSSQHGKAILPEVLTWVWEK
ncbi:alpha/beta hydrolase [Planctomicrobium piriforme]|uniref:Enterochelin esterase n=1 Tax=Planctomicrobium piriforme TaxID=1576369 RepID=A0A1I3F9M8_9PLAN|nr:alpha/beta hydrolase-fold protein [Planctomicrobium piriforme]SFI07927.1 enterochelin esterase [Planctomicrobium piriforme]